MAKGGGKFGEKPPELAGEAKIAAFEPKMVGGVGDGAAQRLWGGRCFWGAPKGPPNSPRLQGGGRFNQNLGF